MIRMPRTKTLLCSLNRSPRATDGGWPSLTQACRAPPACDKPAGPKRFSYLTGLETDSSRARRGDDPPFQVAIREGTATCHFGATSRPRDDLILPAGGGRVRHSMRRNLDRHCLRSVRKEEED